MQAAFKEEHGLQCGFCTPGMMLVGVALLEQNPDPTDDDVRWAISGNLCRCTGYMNIVKAIRAAAADDHGAPPLRSVVMTTIRIRPAHAPPPRDRRHRPLGQAQRGRPLHRGPGQLPRRHHAARHAAHGDPALAGRARAHQEHRHVGGRGARRRGRGRHRRADGPARPGVDADAVGRHPGGAGHRQGAVPGPGGRGGRRDRSLHRRGRARAHRRRLRDPARHHDAAAGARRRRGA